MRCGTKVTQIDNDYFDCEQILVSTKNAVVVGTSKSTVVSFNYPLGKKESVPHDVVQLIQNIEGKIFTPIKNEK